MNTNSVTLISRVLEYNHYVNIIHLYQGYSTGGPRSESGPFQIWSVNNKIWFKSKSELEGEEDDDSS